MTGLRVVAGSACAPAGRVVTGTCPLLRRPDRGVPSPADPPPGEPEPPDG